MQLNQRGFTLAELTIALGIFSVLLLVMTAGVLQLYRIYDAGHQIRSTQEAARTISQDITADTHAALAIAVNNPGPNGTSSICIFQTVQQAQSTLSGVEYYVAAHDSGGTALSGSPAVHRAPISSQYATGTAPTCPATPGTSPDTVITSNETIVHGFQASAFATAPPSVMPELLNLDISVESAYAQQPGDTTPDTSNPGFNQCVAGSNSQYCSITNIHMAALAHAVSGL